MAQLAGRVPWDLLDRCCRIDDARRDLAADSAAEGMAESVKDDEAKRLERGLKDYGCAHYRRRCRIRAPCCDEVFGCRHCHNEAKAEEPDPARRHEVLRESIKKVICSLCNTEQVAKQVCQSCGVRMGSYFCAKCNFFDDDTDKQQFHCGACGICRVGGAENFFHCDRCGCCYSIALKEKHVCVERSMHHNCPVCFEFLFDSVRQIAVLPCGHTMHVDCFHQMRSHSCYTCPICSKSLFDLSDYWQLLDKQIAATPMPESLRGKLVWMLCNDCNHKSEVPFHIFALKCSSCSSFNTRQTQGP